MGCRRAATAVLALTAALALPAPATARAQPTYYVSLGDSWAQGVMRVHGVDRPTDRGFSDVLYRRLRATHPGLRLVKLGCRAATTGTMIHGQKRCGVHVPYRGSQLQYASRFLRRHRGHVALVTSIIGGNEIWSCGCAGHIAQNLPTIARSLRQAAGPGTRIVGLTYANILLGRGDQASVSLFRDEVNPAMKRAYGKQRIGFVNATAGFAGRDAICTFAYVCDHPADVHLNARGYARLARLVEERLTSQP